MRRRAGRVPRRPARRPHRGDRLDRRPAHRRRRCRPTSIPGSRASAARAATAQFRDGVRDYYRDHYPLTAAARANVLLNPGNGGVSRLCHEPRVALAVLEQMLAPYRQRAAGCRCCSSTIRSPRTSTGDRVRAVTMRDRRAGRDVVLAAPYFIDATELGDLLPLTRTEFAIGAESRRETGEPHAPDEADPLDQQAITWCFAVDYLAGEDHTIDKPAEYAFWRDYVPAMTPAWPGRLLSWQMSDPRTLGDAQRDVRSDRARAAAASTCSTTGGSPTRPTSRRAPTRAASRS